MADMIAEEASGKLVASITLDVMRPLQVYDAGGRARALMRLRGVEPSFNANYSKMVIGRGRRASLVAN